MSRHRKAFPRPWVLWVWTCCGRRLAAMDLVLEPQDAPVAWNIKPRGQLVRRPGELQETALQMRCNTCGSDSTITRDTWDPKMRRFRQAFLDGNAPRTIEVDVRTIGVAR